MPTRLRWNSPLDYVGASPLQADYHDEQDHHEAAFLPGVNINANPFCGQSSAGAPLDCGESEWLV